MKVISVFLCCIFRKYRKVPPNIYNFTTDNKLLLTITEYPSCLFSSYTLLLCGIFHFLLLYCLLVFLSKYFVNLFNVAIQ